MANVELNLSESTRNEVVSVLKADHKVHKQWRTAADLLISEGVDVDTLENDKDYRKTFKDEVILLSFTQVEQAIIAKPLAALSDEQKVTRRWIQQQMGTRFNKVVKYVKIAEEEAKMTDDERGARARVSLAEKIIKECTALKERVNKATAVTFPAAKVVQQLDEIIATVKAGFKP